MLNGQLLGFRASVSAAVGRLHDSTYHQKGTALAQVTHCKHSARSNNLVSLKMVSRLLGYGEKRKVLSLHVRMAPQDTMGDDKYPNFVYIVLASHVHGTGEPTARRR